MTALPFPLNVVDVLLGIVVALGVWVGWAKGFARGALELALLVLALVAALRGYAYLAALVEPHLPALAAWTRPLAFLAIFAAVRAAGGIAAGRLLGRMAARAQGHRIDRAFGTLPGLANGLINAAIVAMLLPAVPLPGELATQARDSALADRLAAPAEWLGSKLSPVFDEAVRKSLNRLTVRPESSQSIRLPFTVANPEVREDLEARMLELVNAERRKDGLAPLQPDAQLAAVARAHSADMLARGYFSHVTPDGEDPLDRIRQAGVRFLVAGENLALAPTLAGAHRGLMDSPGHRANILKPAYGRVGIGVLDAGRHGLVVTQNFRN